MPIQLDAIDMVISKQGFFSAVRFFMVPPTKGYRVQPDMDDSFSISTHAHAVNMVHLCRLVANCTPAIFKAEIQVLANIVRLGEQAVLCGHPPMEAKLNQIVINSRAVVISQFERENHSRRQREQKSHSR